MGIKYDRFQVLDIDPIILVRKLIVKSDQNNMNKEQSVQLSMIDFYQVYMDIKLLEKQLIDVEFEIFDTLAEETSSVLSVLSVTEISPKTSTVSATQYYNNFLKHKLNFLKKGMGYLSVGSNDIGDPIINDYQETKKTGLKVFNVTFKLDKLIGGLKKFIKDYKYLQDKMHQLLESRIDSNAPSISKQGQLFIKQVKIAQEHLGINKVNMGMRDWGMRMTAFDLDDGNLCLHPFNMDYRGKAILPFYLEAHGLIDIHDISLVNKLLDYSNADLQYTVSRPCVINIFDSDNTPIPMGQKKVLSETQIVIIEKIFEDLNEALIFAGKPKLKEYFGDLLIWFIKKISYCLEEESFLRDSAVEYLKRNEGIEYVKMEDDFFLPFLFEKLSNTFGSQRVIKKPEKFKGEIDILFDNILPIELKVWKEEHKGLESTVDEKFPHLGQATTYASIDRVGFLVILDISSPKSGIKNIENCWRILTKEFDINKQLPTKIVTLFFNCNHTAPSRL
ncbi:hypothetical protein KAR91_30050 [Candidatus Pacearchaeota archaeon]|nr:hypothetical protein [Candidatus Pacearchaeota archaeon]